MTLPPLLEQNLAAGAILRQESGQPIIASYGDARSEYAALRHGVAIADGSRHGRLELSGQDHVSFLHNFTTQAITGLAPGQATWAVVANWKGTIVDYVEVLRTAESLWVITAPDRAAATAAWFEKYVVTEDVRLVDRSAETAQLELLGPQAPALLQRLGLPVPPAGASGLGRLDAAELTVISHRGIGGPGWRLLMSAAAAGVVWQALVAAGAVPAGEDALSWLRVSDGYPAFGTELGEDTNPWEAHLHAAISLDKGCYLGQEVIARLNTYRKVQRRLVGLDLAPGELPSPGDAVTVDGVVVGKLTSVAVPPDAPAAMALAYVGRPQAEAGTVVRIGAQEATVADRPFWASTSPRD